MKKKILIVDDFENTRFIVQFTLQQRGYEVIAAANGQSALSVLRGEHIDLIITDYNMPQMNGLQLTTEVKKQTEWQRIPIVVLSTDSSEEKRQAALRAGAAWWLKKPFKAEELLALVAKLIR